MFEKNFAQLYYLSTISFTGSFEALGTIFRNYSTVFADVRFLPFEASGSVSAGRRCTSSHLSAVSCREQSVLDAEISLTTAQLFKAI